MSDSFITKKAIASALKELCRTKPFEKISIADITSVCHLNRQTFYYHFQDKYELLSWIYYYEEFAGIAEGISFSNWSERIGQLLMTMRQEKSFFMNTIGEREHTFQNLSLIHIWSLVRTVSAISFLLSASLHASSASPNARI